MPSFLGSSDGKESACDMGDLGSILGWGRCPAEGNGNTLQYSCLENPTDRGNWRATVHGVAKKVGHNLETKQHMCRSLFKIVNFNKRSQESSL